MIPLTSMLGAILLAWGGGAPSPDSSASVRVEDRWAPSRPVVGELFERRIRLFLAPSAMVEVPETLPPPPDVEPAGPVELVREARERETVWELRYPFMAWAPGEIPVPPTRLRVHLPGGGWREVPLDAGVLVVDRGALVSTGSVPSSGSAAPVGSGGAFPEGIPAARGRVGPPPPTAWEVLRWIPLGAAALALVALRAPGIVPRVRTGFALLRIRWLASRSRVRPTVGGGEYGRVLEAVRRATAPLGLPPGLTDSELLEILGLSRSAVLERAEGARFGRQSVPGPQAARDFSDILQALRVR